MAREREGAEIETKTETSDLAAEDDEEDVHDDFQLLYMLSSHLPSLFLLLLFCWLADAATVFSSSLKTCQSQCEERNLVRKCALLISDKRVVQAYPLDVGETHWTGLAEFNYTSRIASVGEGGGKH